MIVSDTHLFHETIHVFSGRFVKVSSIDELVKSLI